ncbi:hypothetical protein [Streptomyces sp. NPDC047000]|uniref:hypothetical protein n=1 Tax=Streptomyces sp. NPDC047000 TaxID=3155474 RepID=UPI0033EA7DFB
MASSSAGFVAGLTAAALTVVGFLGYRAAGDVPAGPGTGTSPAGASAAPGAPGPSGSSGARRAPGAVPEVSGKGERVVYAVGEKRVWLVGAGERVRRTFTVTPGDVGPVPGVYYVTSRSHAVVGTDGTPVEHVVRFAAAEGVTIGFSAAAGKARPAPSADADVPKTGGIRESREDGTAMWEFATIGCRVVVLR